MADWMTLRQKQYLTVEDMAAINNNFIYLKDRILLFGITVNELIDVTVTYDISPLDILQKFNDVEDNIQTLQQAMNEILGIEIKNYEKHIWKKHPDNLKKYVWRWMQILNEMDRTLTGIKRPWKYLLCSNGYPTIVGKRIIIRGDLIG